ncbi:hypothetical protein COCC4DRAFT_27351 [Bipolaris maydis ATCC 48331]|uniref:Ketoreductase domain-containing protein n=1 Tax=Cochliobolus heterostrophus (strain C4 / ATCC 48331 / race T) TaxID=665024 RepID=N4WN35_COCH4|nr:uncharacterized protein COCC4DRAFT_27351 [Bipolaris maydis ATCC 48331]ENI00820.1 hypothetical protein COCC4DRAFT_27351 [Bipolaris maydis ATCC 48331]
MTDDLGIYYLMVGGKQGSKRVNRPTSDHSGWSIQIHVLAGIVNGVMVLRDSPFIDTSWSDFETVLVPKVAGTCNLDELFGEDEASDFFMKASSAIPIVRIHGQSACSAANHYMVSLVRNRRSRELADSFVVIDLLMGLGYILRSEAKHRTAIQTSLLLRMDKQPETTLHDMLAMAIECGRPDSDKQSEGIVRASAKSCF